MNNHMTAQEREERKAQIIQMEINGVPRKHIADMMGISPTHIGVILSDKDTKIYILHEKLKKQCGEDVDINGTIEDIYGRYLNGSLTITMATEIYGLTSADIYTMKILHGDDRKADGEAKKPKKNPYYVKKADREIPKDGTFNGERYVPVKLKKVKETLDKPDTLQKAIILYMASKYSYSEIKEIHDISFKEFLTMRDIIKNGFINELKVSRTQIPSSYTLDDYLNYALGQMIKAHKKEFSTETISAVFTNVRSDAKEIYKKGI